MAIVCDYCRYEFPSHETVIVTDKVLASTRRTTRVYRSTKGGLGFGGSSGETYRYKERTLCLECAETRAAAARRARRGAVLGFLIALTLIAAGVIYVARHIPAASPDDQVSAPTNSDGPVAPDEQPTARPAQVVGTRPDVGETGPAQPLSSSATDADQAATDTAAAPSVRPTNDEIEAAIALATQDALESGSSASWKGGGRSGYVVPSSPQTSGSETCRNASVSEIEGRDQRTLSTEQWCKSVGASGWRKRSS